MLSLIISAAPTAVPPLRCLEVMRLASDLVLPY